MKVSLDGLRRARELGIFRGYDNEPLPAQTARLASFIMIVFTGEPSQNQGAIDTAMRLLADLAEKHGEAE